jgi:AraC-like DNA-binding protein
VVITNTTSIMAVDCCEHITSALARVLESKLTPLNATSPSHLELKGLDREQVSLIAIGIAKYPVRRLFISQLRRIFPAVPILILRRIASHDGDRQERISGEFILSDQGAGDDCRVVTAVRRVFPLRPCVHLEKGQNYEMVRDVVRVITERYRDADLDLTRVSREIAAPPSRLSQVLNQEVGVSFRHLLRQTRIEEAKRLLASRKYSVKEVAALVGFADCHYFSRTFKALTGVSASAFRAQDVLFD